LGLKVIIISVLLLPGLASFLGLAPFALREGHRKAMLLGVRVVEALPIPTPQVKALLQLCTRWVNNSGIRSAKVSKDVSEEVGLLNVGEIAAFVEAALREERRLLLQRVEPHKLQQLLKGIFEIIFGGLLDNRLQEEAAGLEPCEGVLVVQLQHLTKGRLRNFSEVDIVPPPGKESSLLVLLHFLF